jgi:geranylgeranyl pyrophosphate synthase
VKPTDLDLAPLEGDLERFEEVLTKNVTSVLPMMENAARYSVLAGGKRLRPALAIACAYGIKGIEPVNQEILDGACAIELVHAGSLHHDDVIDGATTRRGVPSVNIQFSNTTAILSGDYLLGRASIISAELGANIAKILGETILELCVGQIIEQQNLFDTNRSVEQYLKAIEGKTASLFASTCKIGATISGANEETVDALEKFGFHLGMTFQIIDDLLDMTSTSEKLGKPAGNDINEGNYTLPVIFAIQDNPELAALLNNKGDFKKILLLINNTKYIDPTKKIALEHVEKAKKYLRKAHIDETVKQSFNNLLIGLTQRAS